MAHPFTDFPTDFAANFGQLSVTNPPNKMDDFDFVDITDRFIRASNDMAPTELILAENLNLQDAMSAFEIGEPRLDTGLRGVPLQIDGASQSIPQSPAFHPLDPLLPEEICWVLDTALSFEMEWHAGNVLAHTVFTFLYTHPQHFVALEPDFQPSGQNDPFLTLVLRSAVAGILKSVDLVWRELNIGVLHDTEDWQGDKAELPVMESVQTAEVGRQLDEAISWLSSCSG